MKNRPYLSNDTQANFLDVPHDDRAFVLRAPLTDAGGALEFAHKSHHSHHSHHSHASHHSSHR